MTKLFKETNKKKHKRRLKGTYFTFNHEVLLFLELVKAKG